MKFGLTQQQYEFISEYVVGPFSSLGIDVYVFSSRAKGTYSKFSDLDLLLSHSSKSNEKRSLKSQIEERLIDSNFPYKVDIIFEEDLADSYRDDVISFKKKWI